MYYEGCELIKGLHGFCMGVWMGGEEFSEAPIYVEYDLRVSNFRSVPQSHTTRAVSFSNFKQNCDTQANMTISSRRK